MEDFTSFCKAGNQGTNWAYGEHYELTHNSDGQVFLQLGVMDK